MNFVSGIILPMDLLDRLLKHDAWTTRQLLQLCIPLRNDQLDQVFDLGHRTLRATLTHLIYNMEAWSSLMESVDIVTSDDCSIAGLINRLDDASARLSTTARSVSDRDGWDDTWMDHLENPPKRRTFGGSIAHVITHSMHHRAQVLYMLRMLGVDNRPEGDVLSWEDAYSPPA
ncbi:MAG TPA: DinB family protein [Phycisphaerae bacterium]|nr:DinB family protein [Phycisphaerae bacterium]